MKISLTDAGKRFNRDWIFRHFTYTFETGIAYAITGPNGSGKSTLLQALSGSMMLNEGKIHYTADHSIEADNIYKQVSICAPYLEVIEEMTLTEFLDFHKGFKPFLPGITTTTIIAALGIQKSSHKQIRYFSSGMKQRV
jgi:ABC-type multidrug transport system ATPase subunit